ncbi:MAG: TetR/AcrR family transcriptional regulator [Actinomycetota bacterium]
MARPKSFDVDDVLDRAVEVFWLNGMAATSIEDLVQALGINRGSLYATFNSKEELYHRALDRYQDGFVVWLQELMAADGRPLRSRLRELLVAAASQDDNRGCFMMNTATERNSVDDECRAVTSRSVQSMLDILGEAFAEAVALDGPGNALAPGIDAQSARTAVVTTLQGLRALTTMTTDAVRPAPEPTIDLLLDTLFGTAAN